MNDVDSVEFITRMERQRFHEGEHQKGAEPGDCSYSEDCYYL